MKIGVIGLSPGNGHPISFSAIINGYDPVGMTNCGWPVIDTYLKKRSREDFGIPGAKVTHVWTQDRTVTEAIAIASKIPTRVDHFEDMVPEVDAVLIARDDYETHREFAEPFLEAGKKVFIDKPLTLDLEELAYFRPFIESGQLMSCSGMRYAPEAIELKNSYSELGETAFVRGTVLNDWAKYGIHALETIASVLPEFDPVSILSLSASSDAFQIENRDGTRIQIEALGAVPKIFRVEFFGSRKIETIDLLDNFTMFRGMLREWVASLHAGKPAIRPEETLRIIRTLIAGKISRRTEQKVRIDEL